MWITRKATKQAINSGDGVDSSPDKQNGMNLPSAAKSAITRKGGFKYMRNSLPIVFFVLSAGCAPSAAAVQAAILQTQAAATALQVAGESNVTAAPTNTAVATSTPMPTKVVKPTNTPKPTLTATSVPTATALPQPIVLTGNGNQVVDFVHGFEYAIARIGYKGSSNFIVYNYDGDGNQLSLIANQVGNYVGVVPIDFEVGEHTTRFEVKSSGSWIIEIVSVSEANALAVPGKYEGKGDDVLILRDWDTNPPDIATFKHAGKRNFIVYGLPREGSRYLIVNDIGKYEGQSILERDTILFIIKADGTWSVDVSTK